MTPLRPDSPFSLPQLYGAFMSILNNFRVSIKLEPAFYCRSTFLAGGGRNPPLFRPGIVGCICSLQKRRTRWFFPQFLIYQLLYMAPIGGSPGSPFPLQINALGPLTPLRDLCSLWRFFKSWFFSLFFVPFFDLLPCFSGRYGFGLGNPLHAFPKFFIFFVVRQSASKCVFFPLFVLHVGPLLSPYFFISLYPSSEF